MSPLVGYHATNPKCRESIRANGLLPNRPTTARPHGVYVFSDDGSFDHGCYNSRTLWEWGGARADLWRVAYIGPLTLDGYVMNGVVLLGTVDHVTLVTGNDAI